MAKSLEPAEPQTWRSFLGSIIHTPSEKQRIATALGVSPGTLTHWVKGESNPSQRYMLRLLEVIPQHRAMLRTLLAEEFEEVEFSPVLSNAIPVSLYAQILQLYTV